MELHARVSVVAHVRDDPQPQRPRVVAAALGVRRLAIGRSAAPGVPWAVAADAPVPVALLLKSGNLGAADLFRTAWRTAP